MKKVGKNSRQDTPFSIALPEVLVPRIKKKWGKSTADAYSRYFTELAARDITNSGGVSRVMVSG